MSGRALLVISESGVCVCTEGCAQVTREAPVCSAEPEAGEHVCLTESVSEPVCSPVAGV